MSEEINNEINEEIKLIKQSEVASLGKPVKEVNTKPYFAIYACIIAGIACFFYGKFWILGILILPLAIFALVKMPNEKRVTFFEDCFVIYYPDQKEYCQLIRHDEVEEWFIRTGINTPDFFQLKLTGNRLISVECFNSSKIVRRLNKVMPEREANKKKVDSIKPSPINMNFKWPWRKK